MYLSGFHKMGAAASAELILFIGVCASRKQADESAFVLKVFAWVLLIPVLVFSVLFVFCFYESVVYRAYAIILLALPMNALSI